MTNLEETVTLHNIEYLYIREVVNNYEHLKKIFMNCKEINKTVRRRADMKFPLYLTRFFRFWQLS